MLQPNGIKIDPYNFELCHFKVGAFLRHSVVGLICSLCTLLQLWFHFVRCI